MELLLIINDGQQITSLSPLIYTKLFIALGIIGMLFFIGYSHEVLERNNKRVSN